MSKLVLSKLLCVPDPYRSVLFRKSCSVPENHPCILAWECPVADLLAGPAQKKRAKFNATWTTFHGSNFVLCAFVHPFYQEVNPDMRLWNGHLCAWERIYQTTILTHPKNFPVICLSRSVWACFKSCSTPIVYKYATHAWHVTSVLQYSGPRRRWVSSLSASGSCATLEPLHRTSLQSRQDLRFLREILETSQGTPCLRWWSLSPYLSSICIIAYHGLSGCFLPGCHDVFVHKEWPEEASSWQLIQQVNHQL